MPFKRISTAAAIGLVIILLASPSFGQGPLGAQLFAPADVSTFGSPHVEPNEGYFFSFDGLCWCVQAPQAAKIGAVGFRNVASGVREVVVDSDNRHPEANIFAQTSTEDTSEFNAPFEAGQRWEFGRVEDNNGWLVSIFRWGPSQQKYTSTQANILFDDPVNPDTGHGLLYGRVGEGEFRVDGTSLGVLRIDYNLPTVFDSIYVFNKIDTWGVEASYLRRSMTFHNGGNMELYLGARYLEFNETFGVVATGGLLDFNTHWTTEADNHIIGPQIGGRYFKQQGRWIFSTEGRFTAGYNRQNIAQKGSFGYTGEPSTIQKPEAWLGSEYANRATIDEFSPLVELRLDVRYVVTRSISVRAGWTGFWVDGIARPNAMTEYAVPAMGIDVSKNRQSVLVNGLTIGFDINR
jgi:hypothetical protein